MNKVVLIGRLTKDPEVRCTGEGLCIARYTLAVDRRYKNGTDQSADFIGCIAFGKAGEFAEKYLKKGTKIAVTGRIQTGSYTNNDGKRFIRRMLSLKNRNLLRVKEVQEIRITTQIRMDLLIFLKESKKSFRLTRS